MLCTMMYSTVDMLVIIALFSPYVDNRLLWVTCPTVALHALRMPECLDPIIANINQTHSSLPNPGLHTHTHSLNQGHV